MERYEERLAAFQAVDFDDLLTLPVKLLRDHDEVRAKWQATLRYLLVDEYQDTNATQYELLKLLADPDYPLFTAVGDDDQSIYGWRGATIENLRRLPAEFPKLKVIALEQNYRSTGNILAAANAVIGHNPKLYPKKLWSDLGAGDPVQVVECDGEEHEAERAVARIQALRADGGALAGGGAAKLRTSPSSTAPTTRRRCSSRRSGRRRSPTASRAGRASSTAPRSATSAPGCACSSTRTTTRPSCAPSPPRSAASATRRWPRSASSPAGGSRACSRRCSPSRSAACSARAPSPRCTSSAAA